MISHSAPVVPSIRDRSIRWYVIIPALLALFLVGIVLFGRLGAYPQNDDQRASALQKSAGEAYHAAVRSGDPSQIEDAWRCWKGRQLILENGQSLAVQPGERVKVEEIPSFPIDQNKIEIYEGRCVNHTGKPVNVWLYPNSPNM